MNNLDEKDTKILAERGAAFNNHKGPRVGDFVRMLDGSVQRFSHDWGKDIQTTDGGSFYLGYSGLASMSGGLNPAIMKETLEETDETMVGTFWFFRHDQARAHNGVDVRIMCRVYKQLEG
jgi:hypothetical protein